MTARIVLATLAATVLIAGAPRAQQAPAPAPAAAPAPANPRLEALKQEAVADVESRKVFTQQMVDQIFSYGELGFQEFETHRYLVDILKKNGFQVEEGVAGIPTAFVATWESGKPVIALGSDIDGIPQASQKPGVAWHEPLIEGAPGHGEGHNSGQALNVTAALVVKKIMEREKLPGTIRIWPGTAEELVGTKAYFIRAGLFKDVDVALFTHVSDGLDVSWGPRSGTGLVSVQYSFQGETAHAAGAPWRGRSALDAVELMDIGWNFRREHLRLSQRSHNVIVDGGDQPNVVPRTASVWYYFREIDFPHIKEMWETGDTIAKAAAMMAGVELLPTKVLGAAWPQHFNKVVAETTWANIQKVGMPQWDEDDQTLAKALQKELKNPRAEGLTTKLGEELQGPVRENTGGGSDDIGDVSWNLPTVTLRYPANIPGLPGHNWANAIAMATPIAHKGVTAGAKVQAMTILDLVMRPELVQQAWTYFRDVQTKETKYEPLIRAQDQPAIWLNKNTMDKYRPEMKKYYYDPAKYKTYLEQLGIKYPMVKKQLVARATYNSGMLRPYKGVLPRVAADAFVDQSAQVIGDVEIGAESSVWMNVVVRGDVNTIRVGRRTNIQDGTIVHVMRNTHPTVIGDEVTIGHGAIVHGCTIADRVLIGMGAILLNGVKVGADSIVAAGTLLPEGADVPARSLVMGSPAKVKRALTDEEVTSIRWYAENYVKYRLDYA